MLTPGRDGREGERTVDRRKREDRQAFSGFAEIRAREFARLDEAGVAYLDYTGSALYGASQLAAHHEWLAAEVLGNPHADHEPSRASMRLVDDAREAVRQWLDADEREYDVCFTASATAAIKLVAESYPFGARRACVLAADNHNSVNGLREYAWRAGAAVTYLPIDPTLRLDEPHARLRAAAADADGGLVAFPAQSNFSGVRHPLDLVATAHGAGLDVLLDAAAFVPSAPLSLRRVRADFVALSFYKVFGYPTGIGALVARRSTLARLRRPWFAGGTVSYASVHARRHELRPTVEAFEDGTPDFVGIAGLQSGFDLLTQVGLDRLSVRVAALTQDLLARLLALRHRDGAPLVRLYGPEAAADRGGTVAFNVVDRAGVIVPYGHVERRARAAGVAVRGGCFCNPGAAEAAFGFDRVHVTRCFDALAGRFSVDALAACVGPDVAVGAVRASVGLANDARDLARAEAVIASFAE